MNSTTVTANADGSFQSEVRYSAYGEVRHADGTTVTDKLYTGHTCPGGQCQGDQVNSTTVTANADGSFQSEVRYSAYGEVRHADGTTVTDKLYTGQQQEVEIGLSYYIARWYDPAIAHFIQPDTVIPQASASASYDRYAYVGNNPINLNDPSGHKACDDYYGRGCKVLNPITATSKNTITFLNGYTREQLENASQYQGATPNCGPYSLGIVMSLLTGETESGDDVNDFLVRKGLKFNKYGIPGKPLTTGANLLLPDYLAIYQKNGTIDMLKQNIDKGIITIVGVSWQTTDEIIEAVHWGKFESLTVGHWMVLAGYNDFTNEIFLIDPGNSPNLETGKIEFTKYDYSVFQIIFTKQSNVFIGHGDMITFQSKER